MTMLSLASKQIWPHVLTAARLKRLTGFWQQGIFAL